MSLELKVSLDQWRALIAVVDEGGYGPAAEALDKSQSAVSYAVQKLETVLGVRVFRLEGRRAVLTEAGQVLYRRAQVLIEEASRLELSAESMSRGVEAQLYIAVDGIFPEWLLLECLALLSEQYPGTRLEVLETVLSGTDEALLRHDVDMAITPRIPAGFAGDPLLRVRFVPVAAPDHPLHQMAGAGLEGGSGLLLEDLRRYRQLVVRDSGSRSMDAGWLGAEQRLTVSYLSTSILAACAGLGFAWYPEDKIRAELDSGRLRILPMAEGQERIAQLYLVMAEGAHAGPAARTLKDILMKKTAETCREKRQC